jgi:hypothetical protein
MLSIHDINNSHERYYGMKSAYNNQMQKTGA